MFILGECQSRRGERPVIGEFHVIRVEFDQDRVAPKFKRDLPGCATAAEGIKAGARDDIGHVTGAGRLPADGFRRTPAMIVTLSAMR